MLRAMIFIALMTALPARAAVETCDRITNPSHGGHSDHMDLGNGKVLWTQWWAHEGVFKDVWLADCRVGLALEMRTHEERITDRHLVDRTQKLRDTIISQSRAAPAFFTIERLAGLMRREGAEITMTQYEDEFCACAVAYPKLRGSKTPYEATQ